MNHIEDFLSQWESIVEDVHKTDVPIECIKKVIFKLEGRKQKTINIHALLKQGMEYPEIESVLSRLFAEYDGYINDVDFVIDISSVAQIIQPETDKLLEKLWESER